MPFTSVHTVDNDLISIGALNANNSDNTELVYSTLWCYEVSLEAPESSERTFLWAWCCRNDDQNGRHLLELWRNFIKAVFMHYVDDCRCLYWFFDMFFLIDWTGVDLSEEAPSRNCSNQQLSQSHHRRGNHLESRNAQRTSWSFQLNRFSTSARTLSSEVKKLQTLW